MENLALEIAVDTTQQWYRTDHTRILNKQDLPYRILSIECTAPVANQNKYLRVN